jgi:FAD/FMN-containing dehydrogenase
VIEMQILTGDGRVVIATKDNEYCDLYYGFPNSYGTLGYSLALTIELMPVKPYVHLRHFAFNDAKSCMDAIAEIAAAGSYQGHKADFVDGTAFSNSELYLSVGAFSDKAPWLSDYTGQQVYYKSLQTSREDFLTIRDYIWRWDTDWFWCSRNFGAQNPLVRRLLGRQRLNSRTYSGWMRWNSRWGLTRRLGEWRGVHQESVIQDVDIPLDNAGAFLDFFVREVGISPVWICPLKAPSDAGAYPLYPVKPDTLYINFGFWDVVERPTPLAPGHFNRLVEKEVITLGGIKSLYSDSYFPPDEFAQIYDASTYGALKSKYDPKGRAQGLYEKCVGRA